MPRFIHPRGRDAGVAIDADGERLLPDEDAVYEIGDEAWLDRYAAANDVDVEQLLVDESGGGAAPSWDPADHTVVEVREHVESIDQEGLAEYLEALREAEVDGKDRTTALEAIDDRLDELED